MDRDVKRAPDAVNPPRPSAGARNRALADRGEGGAWKRKPVVPVFIP